jgi:hypothetical protein
MDEQTESKTDKLEQLYDSYNLDSPPAFLDKIVNGEYEVWRLANSCYSLVRWLDQGETLEVLTCAGSVEGAEGALLSLEQIAVKVGAKRIIGLARYGWQPLLDSLGYTTGTKLVHFRKDL